MIQILSLAGRLIGVGPWKIGGVLFLLAASNVATAWKIWQFANDRMDARIARETAEKQAEIDGVQAALAEAERARLLLEQSRRQQALNFRRQIDALTDTNDPIALPADIVQLINEQ